MPKSTAETYRRGLIFWKVIGRLINPPGGERHGRQNFANIVLRAVFSLGVVKVEGHPTGRWKVIVTCPVKGARHGRGNGHLPKGGEVNIGKTHGGKQPFKHLKI